MTTTTKRPQRRGRRGEGVIILRFGKYGTLFRYNGVPMYVGDRLITRRWMCWWWPLNWLFALLAAPVVAYRLMRKP